MCLGVGGGEGAGRGPLRTPLPGLPAKPPEVQGREGSLRLRLSVHLQRPPALSLLWARPVAPQGKQPGPSPPRALDVPLGRGRGAQVSSCAGPSGCPGEGGELLRRVGKALGVAPSYFSVSGC